MTEAELDALHQVMWRLERRWVPSTPDASVHHAYERLPPIDLFSLLRRLGNPGGRVFLDVGCGIGTNLAIAAIMGWTVAGIDRHLPYLEAAAELVPEATLIHADAFDIDRFDADVVYLYRPMVSQENETRLERHVSENANTGTIVLTTSPPYMAVV